MRFPVPISMLIFLLVTSASLFAQKPGRKAFRGVFAVNTAQGWTRYTRGNVEYEVIPDIPNYLLVKLRRGHRMETANSRLLEGENIVWFDGKWEYKNDTLYLKRKMYPETWKQVKPTNPPHGKWVVNMKLLPVNYAEETAWRIVWPNREGKTLTRRKDL